MWRNCPECRNKLTSSDNYFCTTCGAVLPQELTTFPASIKRKYRLSEKNISSVKKKNGQKTYLGPLLKVISLIFIVICGYFLVTIVSNKIVNKNTSHPAVVTKKQDTKPQMIQEPEVFKEFKSGVISGNKEPYYIPFNVDIYVEGKDLYEFAEHFSDVLKGTEYQKFIDLHKNDLKPEFAGFLVNQSGNNIWSFLLFPSSSSQEIMIDKKEFTELQWKKIDDAILITIDPSIIKSVEDSKQGIEKNLNLNPVYINFKNQLPPNGKLFLIPLNKTGSRYLENLLNAGISPQFKEVLNNFLNQKLPALVI